MKYIVQYIPGPRGAIFDVFDNTPTDCRVLELRGTAKTGKFYVEVAQVPGTRKADELCKLLNAGVKASR